MIRSTETYERKGQLRTKGEYLVLCEAFFIGGDKQSTSRTIGCGFRFGFRVRIRIRMRVRVRVRVRVKVGFRAGLELR